MVQKAYGVKITRAKHTGQDWGQALIFTYRHQHNSLTDKMYQRLFTTTVSQQLALFNVTVSRLSALIEVAKEKLKKIKRGTRSATMNFRLKPVNRRK